MTIGVSTMGADSNRVGQLTSLAWTEVGGGTDH